MMSGWTIISNNLAVTFFASNLIKAGVAKNANIAEIAPESNMPFTSDLQSVWP